MLCCIPTQKTSSCVTGEMRKAARQVNRHIKMSKICGPAPQLRVARSSFLVAYGVYQAQGLWSQGGHGLSHQPFLPWSSRSPTWSDVYIKLAWIWYVWLSSDDKAEVSERCCRSESNHPACCFCLASQKMDEWDSPLTPTDLRNSAVKQDECRKFQAKRYAWIYSKTNSICAI